MVDTIIHTVFRFVHAGLLFEFEKPGHLTETMTQIKPQKQRKIHLSISIRVNEPCE